ncbi:hypothetical protein [Fulvivirga sediminis]|uniref:Lipoprotein n=1 Tax=Fulvivirga sediminis TaxID=2803949 RepID=A0A937K1C5_9BACT|nr:hypothetical protein [Fulvivirga sediminis]MBL3657326.1 hypothetical protein [Fulvivirga sediminis]
MKIKSLSSVVLILILINISCAQKTALQSNPNISLQVDRNSDISTSDQNSSLITSGNYNVIRLKFVGPGDKKIDAGMDKTLILKVPETEELEVNDWKSYKGFIEISGCRCLNRGLNPIESGTVKIKKLHKKTWQITADVTATGIDNDQKLTLDWQGTIKE